MDLTDQKKSTTAKKRSGRRKSTKKKNELNLMKTYNLLVEQWYDMFRKLP